MGFTTEPTNYEKTIFSDLQGAWSSLRSTVADNPGFSNWDKMLFHIDEAMSWESIREQSLNHMRSTLILIRNIAVQAPASQEITDLIEEISEILDETIKDIKGGKIK